MADLLPKGVVRSPSSVGVITGIPTARQFKPEYEKYFLVDEFDSRYYSGIDVSIFFEDLYIDEIVNLQYQVLENVMPFYGYANYTFSRTVPGTRIVQGTFTMNFKRSFYLNWLLKGLADVETKQSESKKPRRYLQERFANPLTPEEALQIGKDQGGKVDYNRLNELSAELRNKYWATETNTTNNPFPDNEPLFNNGNDGFTVFIKYGEADLTGENVRMSSNTGLSALPNNTGIGYKEIGTGEALIGVRVTGEAKVIDDSGKPILSIVNFLAKTIKPIM